MLGRIADMRRARATDRRLRLAAVAAVLTACASHPEIDPDYRALWRHEPGTGFVHEDTEEVLSSRDLLERGRSLAREGETDEAIDAFRALHSGGDVTADAALRSEALHEEARALAAAGRRAEAHLVFRLYVERYAGAPKAPEVVQEALDNAFAFAIEGDPRSVAGVTVFTSEEPGLQAVRDLLKDYPRESFSGHYAFRLAEYFFDQGDYVTAGSEFELVRKEYPRTPWAEMALFRIGLCHFRQFKGVPYNPQPLAEARQRFEKFLEEYPRSTLVEDAQGAPGAKRLLAEIKTIQARRECDAGNYYRDRGRTAAARAMYAAVIQEFPGTPAAQEAAAEQKALPPPDGTAAGAPKP